MNNKLRNRITKRIIRSVFAYVPAIMTRHLSYGRRQLRRYVKDPLFRAIFTHQWK